MTLVSRSVTIETASVSTFETVVCGLAMCIVRDNTVVPRFLRLMGADDRSRVGHTLTNLLHRVVLLPLHSIHAPLGLIAHGHLACLHHCRRSALPHRPRSALGGCSANHLFWFHFGQITARFRGATSPRDSPELGLDTGRHGAVLAAL